MSTSAKAVPAAPAPQQRNTDGKFATAPDVEGVAVVERRQDPQRDQLQRAAQKDYTRRMQPGEWINLPNGEFVRAEQYVGFKYPGEKATDMLGRPGDMVANRKGDFLQGYTPEGKTIPGARYRWMVRTSADPRDNRPNETANYARAGRIRYVEASEIDKECEFAVYTPLPTTDPAVSYVTYCSQILVEVLDPRLAYQHVKGWEDMAISRVTDLQGTVSGEPDTHVGNKTAVEIDGPKDQKVGA